MDGEKTHSPKNVYLGLIYTRKYPINKYLNVDKEAKIKTICEEV